MSRRVVHDQRQAYRNPLAVPTRGLTASGQSQTPTSYQNPYSSEQLAFASYGTQQYQQQAPVSYQYPYSYEQPALASYGTQQYQPPSLNTIASVSGKYSHCKPFIQNSRSPRPNPVVSTLHLI